MDNQIEEIVEKQIRAFKDSLISSLKSKEEKSKEALRAAIELLESNGYVVKSLYVEDINEII